MNRGQKPVSQSLVVLGVLIAAALLVIVRLSDGSGSIPRVSPLIGTATLRGTALPIPPMGVDAHTLNADGLQALAQGEVNRAASLFSAAIAADRTFYEPYNNLAFILFEAGRDEEAIQHWREALAYYPESPDANAGLASALAVRGEPDEAWRHYQIALAREPMYVDTAWMQQERYWGPRALAASLSLRSSLPAASP